MTRQRTQHHTRMTQMCTLADIGVIPPCAHISTLNHGLRQHHSMRLHARKPPMHPLPDLQIRVLAEADLVAYKALRDHALAHHEEAFTSDAFTEAARTAQSYRARLGDQVDGGFTLGAWRGTELRSTAVA